LYCAGKWPRIYLERKEQSKKVVAALDNNGCSEWDGDGAVTVSVQRVAGKGAGRKAEMLMDTVKMNDGFCGLYKGSWTDVLQTRKKSHTTARQGHMHKYTSSITDI